MKKRIVIFSLSAGAMLMITSATIRYAAGGKEVTGYTTSAPDGGTGGGTCTNCHSGGATPTSSLTASPAFGAGNTYKPGQVYTLSFNVKGNTYFGFALEMINGAASTSIDAGTFGAAISNCQIVPKTNSYTTVTTVTHTAKIPNASSATWTWTAPASGSVYVWAAGNGVNGNGQTSGDMSAIYNLTLTPASTTGIEETTASNIGLNVFPNPVSGQLHMSYTLDKQSVVSAKLLDMSGKTVSELFEQTMEAGDHIFDAPITSGISSGIYLLSLNVNGQPSVKRIVIR
jgi:hypothetical protein